MKKVLISMIAIVLVVCACCFVACNDEPIDNFPMERDMSVNLEREIGLYFFGDNVNDYVRYSKDLDEKYFDKDKDTMVYFHGWTTVATEVGEVYNFGLQTCDPLVKKGMDSVDYVTEFKKAGYNVCVMDYSQHSSNLFMLADYIWAGLKDEEHSVACMFAKEIADCFDGYGKQLRFFGHSYGAQSSLATAYLLYMMGENGLVDESCLPKRLTIADPYLGDFYLALNDGFLTKSIDNTGEKISGRTPTEIVAEKMEYLNGKGVTIDMYCAMPMAYDQYLDNDEVRRAICESKIKDNCVWTVLKGCQDEYGRVGDIHVIAESWMFESFFASIKMDGDNYMPTAALDTANMRTLIGREFESTYRGVNLDEEKIVEIITSSEGGEQ